MMKSYIAVSFMAFILILGMTSAMYEVDYSNNSSVQNQPNLVVQVLKYEPYPVNAGEWFDLWIKVQNIGQGDAKNARFELKPEYPFSSNDSLIRDYGLIYGTISAYQSDQTYDSSQAILKYRVQVADNAPEGISNLKFVTITDKNSIDNGGKTTLLPIEIGKTKTDFDIVMQSSSTQGTSFALSNTGQNDASAVTVSIEPQDNMKITGPTASIIGNLAKGDFTTVSFQILSANNATNLRTNTGYRLNNTAGTINMTKLNSVKLQIAYTDAAGVRNTIEKIVPVSLSSSTSVQTRTSSSGISNYVYPILAFILGIFGFFVYSKLKKKK